MENILVHGPRSSSGFEATPKSDRSILTAEKQGCCDSHSVFVFGFCNAPQLVLVVFEQVG